MPRRRSNSAQLDFGFPSVSRPARSDRGHMLATLPRDRPASLVIRPEIRIIQIPVAPADYLTSTVCPLIDWKRMVVETAAELTLDSAYIELLDRLDGDVDLEENDVPEEGDEPEEDDPGEEADPPEDGDVSEYYLQPVEMWG